MAAIVLVTMLIAPGWRQDVSAIPQRDTQAPAVPTTESVAPAITAQPAALRIVPGLEEPLVATGPTTAEEEAALTAAITAFQNPPVAPNDFADNAKPLLEYIAHYPASGWTMAIQTNLGLGYYHAGYFSRALAAWEQAWQLGRHSTVLEAKRLTDRAVGELARMHARIGHADQLEALFADMGDRPITGAATEFITGAQEGIAVMRNRPGIAYLCGPKALGNVLRKLKATPEQIKVADAAQSGPHGFSLTQVSELADKAGLAHKLIYRQPEQPVPVPSVINWKVHHYAAIIETKNGKYHLKDPTFASGDLWLTQAAIDAESSGYFLVLTEQAVNHAQSGWREVMAQSDEAGAVYGMGYVTDGDPGGTKTTDPKMYGACQSHGMCNYNAHMTTTSLNLTDTPVGYVPPKGPAVMFTLTYNQREASQPANFTFSNVSPKWTHNWLAYIEDDPSFYAQMPVTYPRGGGFIRNVSTYGFQTVNYLDPELQSGAVLYRLPSNKVATSYERRFPDGSKEVYGKSDGSHTYPRRWFLTKAIDPQGNAVTLNYDAQWRLTSLTDAGGRTTTLSYERAGYPLLITKVTDPFGRFTTLNYDSSQRLESITDAIGITSSFSYDASSLINVLKTPYGTSHFAYGLINIVEGHNVRRWLETTDPLGKSERIEFASYLPTLPGSEPDNITPPNGINTALNQGNTFYWDRYVYPATHTDYTKAVAFHWASNGFSVPEVLSLKKPLERRIWFSYPYQGTGPGAITRPTDIARVLDDGTVQDQRATYNIAESFPDPDYIGNGNITSRTDAVGRKTVFNYASNGIDLTAVRQQTSAGGTLTTIAGLTYNSQHLPQSYTDAAGKVWNFAYNAAGQLIYATNPLNQTRFWEYDPQGRLVKVTIPKAVAFAAVVYGTTNAGLAAEEAMNYTAACAGVTPPANINLPISVTDSGGRTLCFQYDALDRVTTVKYPDGTTDQYSYVFPITWPVASARGKPSLDLWQSTDRLGRVTSYSYDQNRRRTAITEPVTVDDVATTRTTRYEYYANGALKNLIDANGAITHWEFDLESRPTSKTYAYGTADAKTESYSYDLSGRLKTVTDAKGQVLTKTYNADDTLALYAYTNTPGTAGARFTYDPYFPRLKQMADQFGTTNWTYKPVGTNGALRLDTETPPFANATASYGYDAAGRVNSLTVAGAAAETFGYDVLGRLKTHVTALGSITYGYLGNTHQPTSRSLTNGTVTLTTNWGYDTNANDRRLKSITHGGATRSYALDYLIPPSMAANPYDLIQITETVQGNNPQIRAFSYDASDRLLSATSATLGNYGYGYDKLDNITRYDENGTTATPHNNGLNQLKQFWPSQNFDYDDNGNTTREYNQANTTLRGYTYDAADRIIKVTADSGNTTEYRYDGLGRRVKSLFTSGSTTTETRYLWCGASLCQQRNGLNVAQTRFYPEGEVRNGQKLLYVTDHLGSVRDVVDTATGAVVGSLDYTPYGAATRAIGTLPSFRYAGLLWDGNVGLSLATTRFYDAGTGRWLNRDPIREAGGINLYGYVGGNPVKWIDPQGKSVGIILEVVVVAGGMYIALIHPANAPGPGDSVEYTPTLGQDVAAVLAGPVIAEPFGIAVAGALHAGKITTKIGEKAFEKGVIEPLLEGWKICRKESVERQYEIDSWVKIGHMVEQSSIVIAPLQLQPINQLANRPQ